MAEILEPKGASVVFRKERERERLPSEFLTPKSNRYIKIKYVVEYLVAFLLFISLSPLLLTIAVLIKLDSKGEVLFRHKDMDLRESPFTFINSEL